MDEQTDYRRICIFSQIDELQKPYRVIYQFHITSDGAKFNITTMKNTQSTSVTFLYCNANYCTALNLTTFLCENAIGTDNCFDILQEYNIPYELIIPEELRSPAPVQA